MSEDSANAAVNRSIAEPGIGLADDAWHRGWMKIAIALVLAGQGMAFGLAANISPPEGAMFWVLHGGLAASAAGVSILLGGPLLRESLLSLRRTRITVDLFFLVSLLGAFGVSVVSTIRREGPVFYELVAILLAIYTIGKLLGARSRARALRAIDELRAGIDVCVLVLPDGSRKTVAAADVRPGDRALVAPGEAISVDGRIVTGRSLVSTTPLTGEPHPVEMGPGDTIFAGMCALDGSLQIEVTASKGARRLDRVLAAIEEARLQPSRLQNLADRIAARFVPLVILVSAATFVVWWKLGGSVAAIENGLAVLVVACPCALGLATPLGIWTGLVALGRLGIVARSGDFIEALAGVDRALFDKTGTLTEPDLRVARVEVASGSSLTEGDIREVVSAAESGMNHPIARALRAALGPVARANIFEVVDARLVPGQGIRARVRSRDGARQYDVLAGSRALMEEDEISCLDSSGTDSSRRNRDVFVAIDGVPALRVSLEEAPRDHAGSVFAELRELGIASEILTGDPAFSAEVWSDILRRTGMTPEEKAQHVEAAQRAGARVLFVGDGLNDAAALARGDASIALRGGADLARSNALAVITGEGIGTIPAAVRTARAVCKAIRSNLVVAACYNTAGMAIAACGWLDPVLAALLMAGSSAVVSFRVMRAA